MPHPRAIIDAASDLTTAALHRVAELGVTLAIDDLDSGFSSFAYLRHLPVHTVKIDSSFIGRIGQNRDDEIIVKGIIDLSHALASVWSPRGSRRGSSSSSCDEAQGFFLAPPVEPDAVSQWLAQRVIGAEPRVDPAANAVANLPERLSA